MGLRFAAWVDWLVVPGSILVVDDDDSLRLLCRVNLELEGYRVAEAASLGTARTALADGPPDVVLLDLHLGREDGLALLDDLEALEPRPRIVLFTGSAELPLHVLGRVDGMVPKPFDLDDLSRAIAGG
jgi:DNA-binding response OmpR family regulator